jgi:hypothetical protein
MNAERRSRPRVRYAYPIRLSASNRPNVADGLTENLSSDGFYCTCVTPFTPGEELDCELILPSTESSGKCIVLRRRAKVLRLEIRGVEPGFGIGCRFLESSELDRHLTAV